MNGPARKSPDIEDFGLIHSDGDDLQVAKKRRGVGATRRAVGWVLLLLLLVTFALVMRHRILHPQIRYVRSREDMFDESLAVAHAGAVGQRPKRAKRTTAAVRKKAVDAYNAFEDACEKAYNCWNRVEGGLPSGTITPEMAKDALATFDDRMAQLDSADQAIGELARQAEFIKEASRSPGPDATHLSSLYAAAKNLESVFRSQSRTYRDIARLRKQFFEGALVRERGDWASSSDALHGCRVRAEELIATHDRAAEEFHAAANRVFD
jgi:hypothetical protein